VQLRTRAGQREIGRLTVEQPAVQVDRGRPERPRELPVANDRPDRRFQGRPLCRELRRGFDLAVGEPLAYFVLHLVGRERGGRPVGEAALVEHGRAAVERDQPCREQDRSPEERQPCESHRPLTIRRAEGSDPGRR
jgi:hypothetical protein